MKALMIKVEATLSATCFGPLQDKSNACKPVIFPQYTKPSGKLTPYKIMLPL
jgi:hypothetical protein